MLLFIVLLLIEVPVVPPDSHLCFLETAGGFSSARSGSDQSPPPRFVPIAFCSQRRLHTVALISVQRGCWHVNLHVRVQLQLPQRPMLRNPNGLCTQDYGQPPKTVALAELALSRLGVRAAH